MRCWSRGRRTRRRESSTEGDFPEQLPLDQLHLVWFRLYRGRLRIETGSPERGVEELLQVGETVRLVPLDNPSGVPWRGWAAEAFDSRPKR